MSTQFRFVLAIFLMLLVMTVTNLLFPPVMPENVLLPEGTAPAEVLSEGEVPVAIPGASEIAPSQNEPTPTLEGLAPPVERRVVVSSPLYRFEFSSHGARLHSAEMSEFKPLNHDGALDLIPAEAEGYLGQRLVAGSDTLDLEQLPFVIEPEDGLTLEYGDAAKTLSFVYQHPTSSFRFEVEYEFSPDKYIVGVRGRASGLDRPLLLTGLGDGLAFAEADSSMEAREMAYVYNHVQEGVQETVARKAGQLIVEGPLLWGASS